MSAGKLPEGWVETNLQNVASWGSGGTPSRNHDEYYNGNIPWIKTGDLGPKIITNASEYITDAGVQNSSAKFFPKGSVAIAMYGATIGKTSILGIDATTNQACAVGTPLEGITSTLFLYYFLLNEKNAFIKKGKGGAQPNISQTVIKEHIIYLPPLAEQKIITEKLDTLLAQVDSTKARLEQIPQILKRFRQAVLAAAMRGELSETWRTHNSFNISLHKYYELTKGKKLKAKNIAEPCEENTWLRCNIGHIFNVKSGDGLTAKEMNSSGDIPVYGGNGITGYHDKYNTEESTIVIGRVGYYCGSVHLTPEKSWITDNALLVDFNRDLITEKFAYWLLKATNLRVDTSSSAQPVISGAKIYSIEIVVPPIEEQREIVRRVEQLFAYADTIEKQVNNALARVNNLTQSILAKAFRGELTAQWRAENPDLISGENSAAALLEKIKAERAASEGKKASRKKS
ncbi:restriction endonuclease subunit S [Escherichia albertii]|uniref:restriction endonuclease subunit S n=1 Tax=Escherichia albertii TaxID=208962 RepID=UPI00211A0045|nr:restriction endonuclease subunit S [Escherichia albertii]UUK73393.1 restriction endonuclease subunit S [Escherichia albertii]